MRSSRRPKGPFAAIGQAAADPPPQRASLIRVGVADLAVTPNSACIVTYGLGSCVAVCCYDPKARVGGLLHFMLPTRETGQTQSPDATFADTGIKLLFEQMLMLGASPRNVRVKLVGGAAITQAIKFDIGKHNILVARQTLWSMRLPVDAEETGGHVARTVHFDIPRGVVRISSPGREERML